MQEAVRCMVRQARTVTPKAYDPEFLWPYLLVEKRFPEVVTSSAASQRLFLRMSRYVTLAEEFLVAQQPAEALEQLRYIFSHVRGRVPATGVYLRAVELMARCYRELGDVEKAAQYSRRVEKLISNGNAAARTAAQIEKRTRQHTHGRTRRCFP